jgi:hypothetical protein
MAINIPKRNIARRNGQTLLQTAPIFKRKTPPK